MLADAQTIDEAAPLILQGICEALDWSFGALWTLDRSPAGDRLTCAELWHRNDPRLATFEETCRERRFEPGTGLPGRLWATGRPHWINDVVEDSNFPRAAVARDAGLHGALGFPIFVGGEFFGAIEFFSRQIHEPDDDLIQTLSTIVSQIGQLIERERTREELNLQKALLEYQGEAALEGIGVLNSDGRIIYWNRRILEMFGLAESDVEDGSATDLIGPLIEQTSDTRAMDELTGAILRDPETSRRIEAQMADGRVLDAWTAPVRAPDGRILGRVLYCRDATQQKRTEQRLRENERWYSFLAEVSSVMSQTLDYRANLSRLARMVVPMLADCCAVHVVDEAGDIRTVAVAHRDPGKLAVARRLQELFPVDPDAEIGLGAAVRSGSSLLFEEIREEILATAVRDEAQLEQLRTLGFRSAMIVPLICRDRVLGTLTLLAAESGRRYTKEDLRLAEDLAARAAFPLDNARLYEQHARVAQTLQESLLPPELPEIPGVELAARYHAVVQTADVGGDFYDVFPAGPRSWGLALGDVSGKGVEAAAVTSLARHTVRAATMATQRPSEILSVLNAALLEQTEQDRFVTAVYALIEPRFGRVNITVSSGGHPVPYLVRSDGTLEPVTCEGTLLGVVTDPELTDVSVELDFGDKLILYTDGILDLRPRDARFGHQQVEQLFAACSKRGVKSAADLIERSVLELQEGQARDDFALVIFGVRASIFRRVRTPRLWRRGWATDELDASG